MAKSKGDRSSGKDEIMGIAARPAITAPLMTSVRDIVTVMVKEGFRRIPIVDLRSKTYQGIVTSTDIVNYLGGGSKFNIIQQQYGGSFFKAINEPVKSIMQPNAPTIRNSATIRKAIDIMLQSGVGGLPVLDDENKITAIVTERDLLSIFEKRAKGAKVASLMTEKVITASADTTIAEAERTMTEKSFRRLPLLSGEKPVGIVTTMDVVRFFGSKEVFENLRSGDIMQVLQTPALQIGTKELVTISPLADADQAANVMKQKNIGALLVIEKEECVGILTERDFFKLISPTGTIS